MCRHSKKNGKNEAMRVGQLFVVFLVAATLLFPIFSQARTRNINSGEVTWAWVNVKGAHVRKGPGAKFPSLYVLSRGKLVAVLEKSRGWANVQYELGKKGWIFEKNLSFGLPTKMTKADRVLLIRQNVTGDKGIIEVFFNGKINGKVDTLEMGSPTRLIMDVYGLKSERNKSYILSTSPLLTKVKLGVHPKKSRYVLYLKNSVKKFSHNVSPEGNWVSLALLFGSPSKTAAASPPKKVTEKKAAVTHKAASAPAKIVRVTKTGFKDESTRSIIMLNVTSSPTYYVKFLKGKAALILNNARIDKRYMRFFDTSGFPTPIKKVTFKNTFDTKTGERAEIWVTLEKMVPYDVQLSGGVLKWIFKKPEEFVAMAKEKAAAKPAPVTPADEKPVKIAKKQTTAVQEAVKPASPSAVIKDASKEESLLYKPKKYTGTKMSFDFQNADIHNVLRLIAEVSNLNIVAGDDVRGKITLRLKNVPWDQALDIILEAKGLGMEKIGNVLRIAPRAKLKKEIQEKISSKKVKEKLEARVTEYIPVNYTTAKDLVSKVKPILSSRGTLTIDERTNTLIVRDIPKKVADVKDMVKRLDTPTPEVLIESRIVEAAKEFTREVGIKWGANYNAGPQYGNAPSDNFPNQMNVRGGANGQAGAQTGGTTGAPTAGGVLPMVNLPTAAAYGALGITLEQVVDIFTLDVELTAMEDNGLGKVISSPRIATLDNKPAKIEQGLRIPYLKITEEGTVTTEFIEANLNLEVTPHVSNDKMINMEIKVAKDTPDWTHLVQGVPSIDKKEALTNVMVRDGGVTAIGGIFQIERTNVVHKVPLFGDIPILGWAFKNKRTVKNRKELLIFISPKLIPLKK